MGSMGNIGTGRVRAARLGAWAAMVALVLPSRRDRAVGVRYDDPLWERLRDAWNIQVPIWTLPGGACRVLRLSGHLHNAADDYAYLAHALAEELEAERAAGLHDGSA